MWQWLWRMLRRLVPREPSATGSESPEKRYYLVKWIYGTTSLAHERPEVMEELVTVYLDNGGARAVESYHEISYEEYMVEKAMRSIQ